MELYLAKVSVYFFKVVVRRADRRRKTMSWFVLSYGKLIIDISILKYLQIIGTFDAFFLQPLRQMLLRQI